MYTFFSENGLISKNQSGFIPDESTINQLLSITTEICNNYFAIQCRPLETNSILPPLSYKTSKTLSNVSINKNKIMEIIMKLNSKKANGFDGISIAMLKLCSTEVSLPLSLIFKKCMEVGTFPKLWKRANVQPVHKKNSRQIKSNYRPISILHICSKIV